MLNVPALTNVAPLNVFDPAKIIVPVPVFVIPKVEPLTTPLSFNTPEPPNVLLAPMTTLFDTISVPPVVSDPVIVPPFTVIKLDMMVFASVKLLALLKLKSHVAPEATVTPLVSVDEPVEPNPFTF